MITGISNQVLHRDYRVHDLVPQAILNQPLAYFTDRLGTTIERDTDDFDSFEGTALVMNQTLPIALRHYQGHPADTVTVYLSSDINDVDQITSIIAELIDNLNLPKTMIHWERNQAPLL